MPEDKTHDLRERIAAMHQRLAPIQSELAEMSSEIERLLVWDDAVTLAYRERTGEELQPGEPYTTKDSVRADEIFTMYPMGDA